MSKRVTPGRAGQRGHHVDNSRRMWVSKDVGFCGSLAGPNRNGGSKDCSLVQGYMCICYPSLPSLLGDEKEILNNIMHTHTQTYINYTWST